MWMRFLFYILVFNFLSAVRLTSGTPALTGNCDKGTQLRRNVPTEEGYLVSHVGYGVRHYPANSRCRWRIRVPSGGRIEVNIIKLRTESGFSFGDVSCSSADYLKITFNGTLTKLYCGLFNTFPPLISFTDVLLDFYSDPMIQYDGFKLHFKKVVPSACDSSPCCSGQGSCTPVGSGYRCECKSGFTGRNCCDKDVCVESPKKCCGNGECIPLTNLQHTCNCIDGWKGRDCCTPDNRPCQSSPCCNHAQCIDTDSGYDCRCALGWRGTRCCDRVTAPNPLIPAIPICDRRETNVPEAFILSHADFGLKNYPSDKINCSLKLVPPVGSEIEIELIEIILERSVFGNGCSDRLIIQYDNNKTELCSLNKKRLIVIESDSLHPVVFTFSTDYSVAGKGFKLHYKFVDTADMRSQCLSSTRGNSGLLLSHKRFGDRSYPNRADCATLIEAENDQHVIVVEFEKFALEDCKKCSCDNASFWDGIDSVHGFALKTLCGHSKPRPIVTESSKLFMRFQSDYLVHFEGFKAVWKAYASYDVPSFCHGKKYVNASTITNGTIASITAANSTKYPANFFCEWIITAPVNYFVRVKIVKMDIEMLSGSCEYDSLSFYNGKRDRDPLISTKCGSEIPAIPFTSTWRYMYVKFTTDRTVQKTGFRVNYWAVPASAIIIDPIPPPRPPCPNGQCNKRDCSNGQTLYVSKQPIVLSNSEYGPNLKCSYRIETENRLNVVHLKFKKFLLDESEECINASLTVYEGNTEDSPMVFKQCGRMNNRTQHFADITSEGRFLYLVLETSFVALSNSAGFSVEMSAVDKITVTPPRVLSGCGVNDPKIRVDPNGFIQSRFPYEPYEPYEANRDCTWIIRADQDQRIQIRFRDFYLKAANDCSHYLTIKDGTDINSPLFLKPDNTPFLSSRQRRRLCNLSFGQSRSLLKKRFVSSTSVVYVHFKSGDLDSEDFFTGFRFEYNIISQPGTGKGNTCGTPVRTPYRSYVHARIVGGQPAKPHSWPWQLQLLLYNQHFCGASLITPSWGITAAHCFDGRNRSHFWKVIAGSKHTHDREPVVEQSRTIERIFIHKEYKQESTHHDIALFRLTSNFDVNEYVSPICLSNMEPEDFTYCYTTGFGATQGTGHENMLKQAMIPITNREVCNSTDYYGGRITAHMICAGYEEGGHDSCKGDSGGPLQCQLTNEAKWRLHGITSWGQGCGAAMKPGVYTNVARYMCWINATMGEQLAPSCPVNRRCENPKFSNAYRLSGSQFLVAPFNPGTRVTFQCFPGYTLKDRTKNWSICQRNGEWSTANAPECIDIDECATDPPQHTCDPRETVCKNRDGSFECVKPTSISTSCGVSSVNPKTSCPGDFIPGTTGACESTPHSFPWQLLMVFTLSRTYSRDSYCGASLIHPRYAITAAHCVKDGRKQFKDLWTVYAGKHRTETVTEPHQQESKIENIYLADSYRTSTKAFHNDIAVIEFSRAFNITEYVRPICLPTKDFSKGTKCIASGWGHDSGRTNHLNQVTLPIIDNSKCNSSDYYPNIIGLNMTCAGYDQGGRDTCKSDSGGPFVCRGDSIDNYVLYGVISWGENTKCGAPKRPAVFTKVLPFLQFINSQTGLNVQSVCSSSPCVHGDCALSGPNAFTCDCHTGWQGELCDQDVDECAPNTHPSYDCDPVHGTCINTMGGYECGCNPPLMVNPANKRQCIVECGKASVSLNLCPSGQRVYGGCNTDYNALPWIVELRSARGTLCSASLIAEEFAVSAAHCFDGVENRTDGWTVYAGDVRTYLGSQQAGILRIITYPRYTETHFGNIPVNDIILIHLSRKMRFNSLVKPICLPEAPEVHDGDRLVVAGWGTARPSFYPDRLQHAHLPLVSRQRCRNINMALSTYITDSMLCAGFRQGIVDACSGDSGGPLMRLHPQSGRYELIGIVSWGFGCAQPNSPGVYTNVMKFKNWVLCEMDIIRKGRILKSSCL